MGQALFTLTKTTWSRITAVLGWTHTSYLFFSSFLLLVILITYVWWPLAEEYLALLNAGGMWWRRLDWLLLGNFAAMSLLIMAHPDLKSDLVILVVAFFGGLVIESWGTQTELWTYYTLERPPLWILPAWPIASLSIDRLTRTLTHWVNQCFRAFPSLPPHLPDTLFRALYWVIFPLFYLLMLVYIWPTIEKSFTLLAITICTIIILTPTQHKTAVLTFAAGSGLGYFLEVWGTTRACWTYYTLETPPVFAVLAHGMAAVAFWRLSLLWNQIVNRT